MKVSNNKEIRYTGRMKSDVTVLDSSVTSQRRVLVSPAPERGQHLEGGDPAPCSALVGHKLGCQAQCWAPHYSRDVGLLKRVQQRPAKMMQGLEHLFHEERLRAGTTQPGEDQAEGDLLLMYKRGH